MIAALITAGVGALGTAVIFLVMFLDYRETAALLGDARVDAQAQRGNLAAAQTDAANQKTRADAEKRRADALDDLIAKHAAAAVGPVPGSFQRLLQEWAASGDPAGGGSAGAVPALPAAATPGPGDLLKPGD